MVHLLWRRDCVQCPSTPPQCDKCPSGQVCTLSVQTCERCAHATCVAPPDQAASAFHAKSIAGGVVGGLVGLGLILGCILWWKWRHRRQLQNKDNEDISSINSSGIEPTEDMYPSKAPSITTTVNGSQIYGSNVIPILVAPPSRMSDSAASVLNPAVMATHQARPAHREVPPPPQYHQHPRLEPMQPNNYANWDYPVYEHSSSRAQSRSEALPIASVGSRRSDLVASSEANTTISTTAQSFVTANWSMPPESPLDYVAHSSHDTNSYHTQY